MLKTENEKLTIAINRTKAKSNLKEKDEARGRSVRGINNMLSGLLHFSDYTIKTAAANVNKVFAKYGVKIIHESYVTESSLINSLLGDFSASEVQAEIAKLPGLQTLVAELTTAQKNFEKTRVAYESALSGKRNLLNATKLKTKIGAIINEEIVPYLNVMKKTDADKYLAFALATGKIIDNTNEQIKKRRKNESEPETPDE